MADDWKAWLELSLLVAVTLLALGRWIFGREASDISHSAEIDRLRRRTHDLAGHITAHGLQIAALEERLVAVRERLERVEGRRREQGQRP